jgi:hypothetical protein
MQTSEKHPDAHIEALGVPAQARNRRVRARQIGARVHQVALRSSVLSAVHRRHPPIDRKPLAPPAACDDSTAIDNALQLQPEITMNTPLPRASIATRLNAVIAAAFVTLATLGAIDRLAMAEAATPQFAQVGTVQPA